MFRPQKCYIVRKASAVRWLLFLLVVLGSYSLMAEVYAQSDFSSKSIQGTWAFSATGKLPPFHKKPFALAGRITFEEADQCSIEFTMNEGGMSSLSTSDTCIFSVNPDGTGSLQAEFDPGAAVLPELSLFFVIVDGKEILAIIPETVGTSSILKRQEGEIDDSLRALQALKQASAKRYFDEHGIDINVPPTDEELAEFAEGREIAAQIQKELEEGTLELGDWAHSDKNASVAIWSYSVYAHASVSFTLDGQEYCFDGKAGGLGTGVHLSTKAIVLWNDLESLLGGTSFGIIFAGVDKGGAIVGWGSRGQADSTGGTVGIGAFGGKGKWTKC